MMRRRNEKGAALVEAAIITPLFVLMLFGIVNLAFLMGAIANGRYASTDAARAGAVAGASSAADFDIIASAKRAGIAAPKDSVQRVIVYKADGPNAGVPAACMNGPVANVCNVYLTADLNQSESAFGPNGWSKDDFWPAASRSTSRGNGADYLGVYVEVKTNVFFPMLPKLQHSDNVSRLEATSY